MVIISYNVNGIRAALRKDFLTWLSHANPDVICLQEIKATPDQFDETVFHELGYPYCYWYPAQKKGYSGVAILSKREPKNISYGTGIGYMDAETPTQLLKMWDQYSDNDWVGMSATLREVDSNDLSIICDDLSTLFTPLSIGEPMRDWVDAFITIKKKQALHGR